YQPETVGGRANDGVANVPITVGGTYFALVRPGNGTGGLADQYVLDVNVVPTGSVNFPNLVVSEIVPPSGSGLLSGQNIVYSFSVANIGNASTVVGNWIDRAVLSLDPVLGNGDDIPLGFFPRNGALNVGQGYSVTNSFKLPEGISGDFYVIVQTDAGSAVNEYLFKGDNITVADAAFHVNVAPYPDIRVEDLAVAGPDANQAFTITWNTVNRGTATAPAGFYERLLVRNQTTGNLLLNTEQPLAAPLAPEGKLLHTRSLVTTNAATYLVQVVTDSRGDVFEYNPQGHANAEGNNTSATNFQIIAYYTVTAQSSPAGAGLLTGTGTFPSGTPVTLTATADTNTLPYLFVNWTEGGAFQSATPQHTFLLTRDRSLTANFTLPTFLVAASNHPPQAGTVAGQGSFPYGVTNVLIANANFGYRFTNWVESGFVVGTNPALGSVVTSNRFVTAHYVEANLAHVVTTATSPTNVASVQGAGTYTNGQSITLTAPLSVTNPPNIYNFREFQLNGATLGNQSSFSKTFSTLDPTNMQYVALYDTVSILPLITNVTLSHQNVVPATTNFVLRFQFNRGMDPAVAPVVTFTNLIAGRQAPLIGQSEIGAWSSTRVSNDTYSTLPIAFVPGMDGTQAVWVAMARDLNGSSLALTNVRTFVVDATAPLHPVLTLSASNSTSATVSWSGYNAPSDLASFRVYLITNSFTSVAALSPITALSAGARSYTYHNLAVDRAYYAAIASVDNAGNSTATVTPFAFNLQSTIPMPVSLQVAASGADSATVSWNGYNTASLIGFAGFRLYYETTNFSSVAGLTVRQTLGVAARSVEIPNLDRSKTYYFAVVGQNV
ncbi:MAG TPA: fibronectin type III domain-containing protein, partial [Clostridia bacterium]|nr:fibronectin type III domain-containing protein [Clostridia bacterium]